MAPISWLPLLVAIIILGAMVRAPWVIIFSGAAIVVIIAAQFWRQFALRSVIYRRRWIYRRGFPGENTEMRIEVENRKWLPVSWLRVVDPWPLSVSPEDGDQISRTHLPEMMSIPESVAVIAAHIKSALSSDTLWIVTSAAISIFFAMSVYESNEYCNVSLTMIQF
jgi:hypothetical protein